MTEELTQNIFTQVGNGFLSGQLLSTLSTLFHSIRHAPSGQKVKDFINLFPRNSAKLGVQMACFEAINFLVSPYIKRNVNNELLQNVLSGAATGLILSIRNDKKEISKKVIENVGQCLALNALGNVVEASLKPFDEPIAQILDKDIEKVFYQKRCENVLVNPVEGIRKTFIKKI